MAINTDPDHIVALFAMLAQGVVNIESGYNTIERGSRVHTAMLEILELRNAGVLVAVTDAAPVTGQIARDGAEVKVGDLLVAWRLTGSHKHGEGGFTYLRKPTRVVTLHDGDRVQASTSDRDRYTLTGYEWIVVPSIIRDRSDDLVTVQEATKGEPGESIPAWSCPSEVPGCNVDACRHVAPPDHAPIDRGVQRTAVADRCAVCQLPAHLTDVPNTMEQHPALGRACYACRDTHDVSAKILEQLSRAPSCQLNQTTIARKLGRKPSTLNRALQQLSHAKLIERPYKNAHEKPSATTYRLTDAGSRAHFANTERKEHHVSP